MKKFFLPVFLVLTLSSCSPTAVKCVSPDLNINGLMTFEYMQSDYAAQIKTDENGGITADIHSPENLKGISVVCRSDGMTVKCGEIEIDCTDGYFPFRELYNAVNAARTSEPISTEENNGEYSFAYKENNGQYTFITDETGKIKYISTPECTIKKR